MWRMKEEEVHVSIFPGIDLLDALQAAKIGLPLTEAGVANLSSNEDLFTRQTALLQRNTHLFLILIDLCGINVTISSRYRADACLRTVRPVNLIDSETENWHPPLGVPKRNAGRQRQFIERHNDLNTWDFENVQLKIVQLVL